MGKTIDFRALQKPFLKLIMNDGTEIRVTTPTADLVENVRANLSELINVLKGEGAEQKKALYDLAARLIDCNLDAVKVSADSLRNEYDWSVEDLTVFYTAYVEFIEEIENAKN